MKKLITLAVVGLLAVGLLGPADAAKKKKKKPAGPVPVELQFFLRAPESCADAFLSLTDGQDVDCVYIDQVLNPVYAQTGGALDGGYHYPASDGVPLTLDPTRKVAATIGTRGANGTGAGMAEFEFTLVGEIGGEEKVLASHTESGTFGPGEVATMEFEMELDAALAGAVVDALRLDIMVTGANVLGRGVEHDEPVSSIKVPALK